MKSTPRQSAQFLFAGRKGSDRHLTTRQYARLLDHWLNDIGLEPRLYGTHSLRRTNGAEMLRVACTFAMERGVTVCAPNHDALLIEAPLEDLADTIRATQAAMAEASAIVLDCFSLRTSVTEIRHPDQYPHPRSDLLWADINRALARLEGSEAPAHKRNTSRSQMHHRPISLYVSDRRDRSDAND
jgi:hypothetical protein